MSSVREATFDVARQHGMTVWFGNPGSTEIPLLSDLPDDMRYVLTLHENAAVGAAAGYAIASDRPAMVSVHTTAGLGNAVNALATARVNRAPLVILVGQQDRRHLLAEQVGLERLHARDHEQQGGIVGHEAGRGDDGVSSRLEVRQETAGDLCRLHQRSSFTRSSLAVCAPSVGLCGGINRAPSLGEGGCHASFPKDPLPRRHVG